jgi:gluconokinase
MNSVFVIMGVSGSGKTTVGLALAQKLGAPFYDGDDFHPPQNIAKMAAGIPLDDEDRFVWLVRLHDLIADHLARGETAVVACSALKKKYREQLRQGNDGLRIVYLDGSFDLIRERMEARPSHYMKANMLQSQFETLEPPSPHDTLILSADDAVDNIVNRIVSSL